MVVDNFEPLQWPYRRPRTRRGRGESMGWVGRHIYDLESMAMGRGVCRGFLLGSSSLWREPALLGLSGACVGDPPGPAAVPKRVQQGPPWGVRRGPQEATHIARCDVNQKMAGLRKGCADAICAMGVPKRSARGACRALGPRP
eukprot:1331893-Pyramimonas_sp.AAC.1